MPFEIGIDEPPGIDIKWLVPLGKQSAFTAQLRDGAPLATETVHGRAGIGACNCETVAAEVAFQRQAALQVVRSPGFLDRCDHDTGLAVFLDDVVADTLVQLVAVDIVEVLFQGRDIQWFPDLDAQTGHEDIIGDARAVIDAHELDDRWFINPFTARRNMGRVLLLGHCQAL